MGWGDIVHQLLDQLSKNEEYKRDKNTNYFFAGARWRLVSLFSFHTVTTTLLFVSLVLSPNQEEKNTSGFFDSLVQCTALRNIWEALFYKSTKLAQVS